MEPTTVVCMYIYVLIYWNKIQEDTLYTCYKKKKEEKYTVANNLLFLNRCVEELCFDLTFYDIYSLIGMIYTMQELWWEF